jgi:hypothetical protein
MQISHMPAPEPKKLSPEMLALIDAIPVDDESETAAEHAAVAEARAETSPGVSTEELSRRLGLA